MAVEEQRQRIILIVFFTYVEIGDFGGYSNFLNHNTPSQKSIEKEPQRSSATNEILYAKKKNKE